jgi:chromosome segregation ATPase
VSLPALKDAEPPESSIHMLRDLQASLSEFVRPRDLNLGQRAAAEPAGEGDSDVVAQLDALNNLVTSTKTALQTLAAAAKDHQATVSDLKNRLAEEATQKDTACQQADKFARAIKVEEERAAAADARTTAAEEKFKSLRDREAIVRERIDRLTANVASLASNEQHKPRTAASGRPDSAVNRAS